MSREAGRYPALADLGGLMVERRYCRMVPDPVPRAKAAPDFLYTSGKPGRYNPRGCLYASEDMAVAGQECERYLGERVSALTVYWVHVSGRVIDLSDPLTLERLGLEQTDLFQPWRFSSAPTPTQLLGEAISQQRRFAGIRFPSDAAMERGFQGFNLVVFKSALHVPAELIVRSDRGEPLARWP